MSYSLYDIGYIWYEYATVINESLFPLKIFIAPKGASWNFRRSPCGQFLKTMSISGYMDEIDLFDTKVPNKSATVKLKTSHFNHDN